MYEQLQVIFDFYFLVCNCSHIQTIASHNCILGFIVQHAIVHMYKQLQVIFDFDFLVCNNLHI
jgi:hypothetical protein